MAITYPLNTPTDIGIAQIELIATDAVAISQSPFTFATQVHAYAGQMWSANITIPPSLKALAEPWVAFLLSLRGQYGTFLLGDPNMVTPRGSALVGSSGAAADNGAASGVNLSGDSVIYADGFVGSETDLLLPGDYIQLGSGSTATLHKVLAAVDSDSNGSVEIDIWPAIRRDLTDNEAITLSDCKGVFRLATNTRSWSINDSSQYGIQFEAMEAIS